jgi:GST-like protein
MYTLYGSRASGSAAIEMALGACGFAWRQVRASSWEPDSAIEELARVNPLRQIPTLVLPDGIVLTESAAILIHLGLIAPQSRLLPDAPDSRANAIRGLVYIAANCYSAISICDYPERWTTATAKSAREQVRAGAHLQLYRSWDIFADSFAAHPYLSGTMPGALDFLSAVVSRWSGAREHLATQRPRFLEVLQLIEAHPLVQPIVSAHWEGTAP